MNLKACEPSKREAPGVSTHAAVPFGVWLRPCILLDVTRLREHAAPAMRQVWSFVVNEYASAAWAARLPRERSRQSLTAKTRFGLAFAFYVAQFCLEKLLGYTHEGMNIRITIKLPCMPIQRR